MIYEIRNSEGQVENTIVCDDPEFAKTLGDNVVLIEESLSEAIPIPAKQRETAYNKKRIIEWDGEVLTITQAAQLWQYYAAEGNERANELTALIAAAKQTIREQYPD